MPVFSLKEAKDLQVKNISESTFKYWPEGGTYGYHSGGISFPTSTLICTISRLDFLSDVVSLPGKNLPSSIHSSTSLKSNLYGYFCGGYIPFSSTNTIVRLDFSNENISLPGKNLPSERNYSAGFSSGSYGYFCGGNLTGTVRSEVFRLDFSNETMSLPGKNLILPQSLFSGTISNNSYGYLSFSFGPINQWTSLYSRLDFLTENWSTPSYFVPPGSQTVWTSAAVSSSSYGYYAGGGNPAAGIYSCRITRLEFSNETTTDPGRNLPTPRFHQAGFSSNDFGYFGGGYTSPPTAVSTYITSQIFRLDFSSEVVTVSPSRNLPVVTTVGSALPGGQSIYRGSKTYGYWGGGFFPPTYINTVVRLDFSNETINLPGKNLPTARANLAATSNNYFGYFGGGIDPTITNINIISRLDFSNETVGNITSGLLTVRRSLAATSSSSYGYFGGGVSSSVMDRLDFFNETTSNRPASNLPAVRESLAATSSSFYAYFGGGFDSGAPPVPLGGIAGVCSIVRLDFSSETISNLGNVFSTFRRNLSATSSNLYGYFAGGQASGPGTYLSTISRLDFSNETVSNSPTRNLPFSNGDMGATSSSFYGYFGGGYLSPPFLYRSLISRLDFSTEVVDAPPTRNLPSARGFLAAVSNSN